MPPPNNMTLNIKKAKIDRTSKINKFIITVEES